MFLVHFFFHLSPSHSRSEIQVPFGKFVTATLQSSETSTALDLVCILFNNATLLLRVTFGSAFSSSFSSGMSSSSSSSSSA
mmetsp:Transcript_23348/g.41844  ORF Transcript_23348/g.41844 Transcript_23348/m.41844 type:complete len:81 (-) Transcript_23348:350-592(-)